MLNDGWTRYSGQITMPIGSATLNAYLYPGNTTPAWVKAADGIDIRRFLIEESSTLDFWFDGSLPDLDAYFYSWEGTADSSVSALNTWN